MVKDRLVRAASRIWAAVARLWPAEREGRGALLVAAGLWLIVLWLCAYFGAFR